ncbi:B95 [miniopterid betaherpesvirus 1]|uniref:B95 n=1 Tax=miniopterid betaherpesvirus 1 TaxID=3070189 RepID=I3VQ88_9BETA|nr:B95 [miniopterid betaherpesvirus 1]AFK83932.1 B95 [miniopterid betaherpesvirus 1]
MSAVSAALCSVQRFSDLYERDVCGESASGVAGIDEGECLRYDEAVDMALTVCEASAPGDRFRLIETPAESFLLVTNVLPKEVAKTEAKIIKYASPRSVDDDFPGDDLNKACSSNACSYREYVPRSVTSISYAGSLLANSYIVYTKTHLEKAMSLDKTAMVSDLLRYVDTPGILSHNNVSDVEALLWLLFCGPKSLCRAGRCLGCDDDGHDVPFPILLPPMFYEPVTDYLTYINLAELYVYVWYKDYEFKTEEEAAYSGEGLRPVTLGRVNDTLSLIRARFTNREVPIWSTASQTCVLCALYQQNRLCLDFVKGNVPATSYSPIILKDCHCAVTNVTLSHVLPGDGSVTLFPIYNIGTLLTALRRQPTGEVTFEF